MCVTQLVRYLYKIIGVHPVQYLFFKVVFRVKYLAKW